MATKSRRKNNSVSEALTSKPGQFSFFQAVRLLQNGICTDQSAANEIGPVGFDVVPYREAVHFNSTPRLSYPGTEVTGLQQQDPAEANLPPNLQVSFMGLTGAQGVLPTHYTELLQNRNREKDGGLGEFLNILDHRTISLFYRAWQKYQLPVSYELHHQHPLLGKTDSITGLLHALVGVSDENVRGQLPVNAEQLLYYAGQFSSSRRSAPSLDLLLKTCFQVPVKTKQFIGEWVDLDIDDRMKMPEGNFRSGKNNQLGVNTMLGKRAHMFEGKFQLQLGPLSKQQFKQIKPGSEKFKAMCKLTQLFTGVDLKFNVNMKVEADAVSGIKLQKKTQSSSRLGWDTWLVSKDKKVDKNKIDDIVVPADVD